MKELMPPFEHRVPEGAADNLEMLIYEAQLGSDESMQSSRWVMMWDQLKRYDEAVGVEPNRGQIIRLLVHATQAAQLAWHNGEVSAQYLGVKNKTKPLSLLVRPAVVDVPPEVWQYVASFYVAD